MEKLIKIFNDYIPDSRKDYISDLKILNNIYLDMKCYIIVITEKESISFYLGFIQNKKVEFYKFFGSSYLNFKENEMFPYTQSILSFQIDQFRYNQTSAFFYDFNHDGNDEMLSFFPSGRANLYTICSFDFVKKKINILFEIDVMLPLDILGFEFIIYKGKQGIKINVAYCEAFENTDREWAFFYYDHIQQKYIQDKTALSEELEKIHGSPDFFAEAGIDYTKLERPLLPADLEGFSKAALRIWRNAVYARHGRIFKSEDLQALFNEYIWYKPDENYSDDKLTDTDRANIKLIQKFEEK